MGRRVGPRGALARLARTRLSRARYAAAQRDPVRYRLSRGAADRVRSADACLRPRRGAALHARRLHLGAQRGSLALFFIAVVIVAPITEEIAFRGFLFRGLSASWLGVAGTTVLTTSAAWAAMHVQYDWSRSAQIFLIGLLLGWLRWASGSTLLTILLHVLANLAASVQAAIKVEWRCA